MSSFSYLLSTSVDTTEISPPTSPSTSLKSNSSKSCGGSHSDYPSHRSVGHRASLTSPSLKITNIEEKVHSGEKSKDRRSQVVSSSTTRNSPIDSVSASSPKTSKLTGYSLLSSSEGTSLRKTSEGDSARRKSTTSKNSSARSPRSSTHSRQSSTSSPRISGVKTPRIKIDEKIKAFKYTIHGRDLKKPKENLIADKLDTWLQIIAYKPSPLPDSPGRSGTVDVSSDKSKVLLARTEVVYGSRSPQWQEFSLFTQDLKSNGFDMSTQIHIEVYHHHRHINQNELIGRLSTSLEEFHGLFYGRPSSTSSVQLNLIHPERTKNTGTAGELDICNIIEAKNDIDDSADTAAGVELQFSISSRNLISSENMLPNYFLEFLARPLTNQHSFHTYVIQKTDITRKETSVDTSLSSSPRSDNISDWDWSAVPFYYNTVGKFDRLIIKCYQFSKNGEHVLIGFTKTSIHEIITIKKLNVDSIFFDQCNFDMSLHSYHLYIRKVKFLKEAPKPLNQFDIIFETDGLALPTLSSASPVTSPRSSVVLQKSNRTGSLLPEYYFYIYGVPAVKARYPYHDDLHKQLTLEHNSFEKSNSSNQYTPQSHVCGELQNDNRTKISEQYVLIYRSEIVSAGEPWAPCSIHKVLTGGLHKDIEITVMQKRRNTIGSNKEDVFVGSFVTTLAQLILPNAVFPLSNYEKKSIIHTSNQGTMKVTSFQGSNIGYKSPPQFFEITLKGTDLIPGQVLKVGAIPYLRSKSCVVHKSPVEHREEEWTWVISLPTYGGLDSPITFEMWSPGDAKKRSHMLACFQTTIRSLTFWRENSFLYLRTVKTKVEKKKVTTSTTTVSVLLEIVHFTGLSPDEVALKGHKVSIVDFDKSMSLTSPDNNVHINLLEEPPATERGRLLSTEGDQVINRKSEGSISQVGSNIKLSPTGRRANRSSTSSYNAGNVAANTKGKRERSTSSITGSKTNALRESE